MAKDRSATQKRFWVQVQHDEITVEESADRPDLRVQKGERMKKVRGPYATREDANRVKDEMTAKTLRAQAGR